MPAGIQETFSFTAHFSRRVEAGFTAGRVSSDGGALLLREADRKIGLLGRLASCFQDKRQQEQVEHPLAEMLSQRIYGLALGYEDLNDHGQLRSDAVLGLLSGKRKLEEPLAGKSSLNRLELVGRSKRYHKISYSAEAIDGLLGDLYIESHSAAPEQVVLDLDATDIPLYGHQPERFFHGYCDSYCYLPLYIFAGGQLLCARLRAANRYTSQLKLERPRKTPHREKGWVCKKCRFIAMKKPHAGGDFPQPAWGSDQNPTLLRNPDLLLLDSVQLRLVLHDLLQSVVGNATYGNLAPVDHQHRGLVHVQILRQLHRLIHRVLGRRSLGASLDLGRI